MYTLNCTSHDINVYDEKQIYPRKGKHYSAYKPLKQISPSGLVLRIIKDKIWSIQNGWMMEGIPQKVAENCDNTMIIVSKLVYNKL